MSVIFVRVSSILPTAKTRRRSLARRGAAARRRRDGVSITGPQRLISRGAAGAKTSRETGSRWLVDMLAPLG